jgi:hypothetical protein
MSCRSVLNTLSGSQCGCSFIVDRIYAFTALFTIVLGHPSPTLDSKSQRRLPGGQRHHDFGPLRFSPAGTFHISIFEDLHFGESESPA